MFEENNYNVPYALREITNYENAEFIRSFEHLYFLYKAELENEFSGTFTVSLEADGQYLELPSDVININPD